MLLMDKSGEITTNVWDVTDEQEQILTPGTVIKITGKISEFNHQQQIDIDTVTIDHDHQPEDLLLTAPEDYQKMKNDLMNYFYQIKNPVYQIIVKQLLKKHEAPFLTWPAAVTVHHNFYHGLLFHTLSILRQVNHLADQYPQLNRELMIAGAIIHDMGKTVELSGTFNTEYTTPGKLLGHIAIIDGEINRIAQTNNIPADNQSLVLLRHMVLSHHGKLEYGSPVEPQLLEAICLHMADETDANINTISQALNKTAPNDWSEKLWTQNNHQFYKAGDNH